MSRLVTGNQKFLFTSPSINDNCLSIKGLHEPGNIHGFGRAQQCYSMKITRRSPRSIPHSISRGRKPRGLLDNNSAIGQRLPYYSLLERHHWVASMLLYE